MDFGTLKEKIIGGVVVSLTLWLGKSMVDKFVEKQHQERIFKWMSANTSDEAGEQFQSTRSIASGTNFSEDRVRYICSIDARISLCTKGEDEKWGLSGRESKSIYEEPGNLKL